MSLPQLRLNHSFPKSLLLCLPLKIIVFRVSYQVNTNTSTEALRCEDSSASFGFLILVPSLIAHEIYETLCCFCGRVYCKWCGGLLACFILSVQIWWKGVIFKFLGTKRYQSWNCWGWVPWQRPEQKSIQNNWSVVFVCSYPWEVFSQRGYFVIPFSVVLLLCWRLSDATPVACLLWGTMFQWLPFWPLCNNLRQMICPKMSISWPRV